LTDTDGVGVWTNASTSMRVDWIKVRSGQGHYTADPVAVVSSVVKLSLKWRLLKSGQRHANDCVCIVQWVKLTDVDHTMSIHCPSVNVPQSSPQSISSRSLPTVYEIRLIVNKSGLSSGIEHVWCSCRRIEPP